jgi:hypothetical protein
LYNHFYQKYNNHIIIIHNIIIFYLISHNLNKIHFLIKNTIIAKLIPIKTNPITQISNKLLNLSIVLDLFSLNALKIKQKNAKTHPSLNNNSRKLKLSKVNHWYLPTPSLDMHPNVITAILLMVLPTETTIRLAHNK